MEIHKTKIVCIYVHNGPMKRDLENTKASTVAEGIFNLRRGGKGYEYIMSECDI